MSCIENEIILENLYDEFYEQFRAEGWFPGPARILALKYAYNKFNNTQGDYEND